MALLKAGVEALCDRRETGKTHLLEWKVECLPPRGAAPQGGGWTPSGVSSRIIRGDSDWSSPRDGPRIIESRCGGPVLAGHPERRCHCTSHGCRAGRHSCTAADPVYFGRQYQRRFVRFVVEGATLFGRSIFWLGQPGSPAGGHAARSGTAAEPGNDQWPRGMLGQPACHC